MINESTLSTHQRSIRSLGKKRIISLLEIMVAFLPIFIFGIIGTRIGGGTPLGAMIIHLGYALSIIVATVVLKQRGTGWQEIGLARPGSWLRTVLLGFASAIGVIVTIVVLQNIARNLPGTQVAEADMSRFNPLEGNLPMLLISVFLAWTAVAFGEEMMYRAFLIDQLGEVFQSSKLRWVLALVASSVLFGLVHFYQGPLGIVITGLTGLVFGVIYLRSGRNLWVTIIAHGLVNTLSFVLIFFGLA